MEALSSLLTGSSLLHTASSMPLGKLVYMIKHTIQHVNVGRFTNTKVGKGGLRVTNIRAESENTIC